MLLVELKKLMQKISPRIRPNAPKQLAETSESEGASNMEESLDLEVNSEKLPTDVEVEEGVNSDVNKISRDISTEIDADLEELRTLFPELKELQDITELSRSRYYDAQTQKIISETGGENTDEALS